MIHGGLEFAVVNLLLSVEFLNGHELLLDSAPPAFLSVFPSLPLSSLSHRILQRRLLIQRQTPSSRLQLVLWWIFWPSLVVRITEHANLVWAFGVALVLPGSQVNSTSPAHRLSVSLCSGLDLATRLFEEVTAGEQFANQVFTSTLSAFGVLKELDTEGESVSGSGRDPVVVFC